MKYHQIALNTYQLTTAKFMPELSIYGQLVQGISFIVMPALTQDASFAEHIILLVKRKTIGTKTYSK